MNTPKPTEPERLKYLFSGWDNVQVTHVDSIGAVQVRLLVHDEKFLDQKHHLTGVNHGSRNMREKVFTPRNGLRFYGRKGASRGRFR
jgi:hypothetical protein